MAARKVSEAGNVYYTQADPKDRGFERKVFRFQTGEGEAFDADAKAAGESAIGYLRKLWIEDRERRGLPAWEPPVKK